MDNRKVKAKESIVTRKRKLTKDEKDMFNFDKKCIICMERKVDAIVSPCHHGGICFDCAKITLETRNSCYYCRDVIFSDQACLQGLPSKSL